MPNEESYQAVLKALSDLAAQIRTIGDISDQWRIYRDTINRAINLLNHEVLALAQRFDTDDTARKTRQQQIDEKMETIITGQEQIKRWQAIRLGIEIAAVLIVIAFFYGVTR